MSYQLNNDIFDRLRRSGGNVWRAGLASSTPGDGLVELPGSGEGPPVYVPQDAFNIVTDPQYNPTNEGSPFSRAHIPGGSNWNEIGKPFLGLAAGAIASPYSTLGRAALHTTDPLHSPGSRDPSADSHSFSDLVGNGGSMNLFPVAGGGGNAEPGQGGLFDNFLGNLGNLSPAILAGYLGNQQRQDVMGQVGRLNTLGDSLSGPGFMNSITNPYDLQTGQGRTALTQNLQQRGVGGSSFGNQQLGNYDYMRGLGRGDLATRAQAGIAGTQGQLYSDALRGIVGGNAAYNQLLGSGLGASGSLFNRPGGGSTGNGLFDWLRNLGGGLGGEVPGIPGSDPNIDPNTGLPANYPGADGSIDPNTGFPDMGTVDPSMDFGAFF